MVARLPHNRKDETNMSKKAAPAAPYRARPARLADDQLTAVQAGSLSQLPAGQPAGLSTAGGGPHVSPGQVAEDSISALSWGAKSLNFT